MKITYKILFLILISAIQSNAQGYSINYISSELPIKQSGSTGEKSMSNFPRRKDLSANLDLPVINQGHTHSCLAISICIYAYAIQRTRLDKAFNAREKALSAMFPYLSLKNNNCDASLRIGDLKNFLLVNGNLTYNQFTTDNCSEKITPEHRKTAKKNKYINDIELLFDKKDPKVPKKSNSQIREAIKEEIARNERPVIFGMRLYSSLKNLSSNDDFFVPSQTDRESNPQDGHAMTIVGYDDNKNAFKILNSWGEEFGQAGYFWMKYNDLATEAIQGFALVLPDKEPSNTDLNVPVKMGGKFNFLHEKEKTNLYEETEIPFHRGLGLYELNKKNWEVGQLFQLTTTNSNSGQSICVFSIDNNNSLTLHWPNIKLSTSAKGNDELGMSISDQMPSRNHLMYIPNEEEALRIDHPGTDYLCVLYSEVSIVKDIQNIIRRINSKPQLNIVQRIQFGLGERFIQPTEVEYQKNGMGFQTTALSGNIVPVILKIESVNN